MKLQAEKLAQYLSMENTRAETRLALDKGVPKAYNMAINYLKDLFTHNINISLNFKT